MTPPRYRAIDPAVLMAMAGDRATFNALSHTFLDCAQPILEALRQALASGQHAAIASQSHALKGMTMLVGAAELTTLLQQLETAARRAEAAPAAAAALEASFEQVRGEVTLSLRDDATGAGD